MNPILIFLLIKICLADTSAVHFSKHCTCNHNGKYDTVCLEWTCEQWQYGKSKYDINQDACIDGSQIVTVYQNNIAKRVPLHSLRPKDQVLSMGENGETQIDTFIDFMHIDNKMVSAVNVTFSTGHLLITNDHLVALCSNQHRRYITGDQLKLGDTLCSQKGEEIISGIEQIQTDNLMVAPLTSSGTILVNAVLCSNFATYQHHLANKVFLPYRIFSSLFTPPSPYPLPYLNPYVKILQSIRNLVPSAIHDYTLQR